MTEDTRKSFHHELESVRQDVARMAALVTEAIPRGTRVLLSNDLEGGRELIDSDDVLDALSLELEEHCYQLLALQQPMASDLRALVTALKLNSEIERSGDLVVNIAKGARRIYAVDLPPKLRGIIERMSEEAAKLVRFAIDAYLDGDAGKASALDDMDNTLDHLQRDLIQAIFEAHAAEGLELEATVQLALIARYYERIGDHAVNIGEQVHYMVTGLLPEHA